MKLTICIKNKDYFGIYKSSKDYQLKLAEISETKAEVKQYIKLIEDEKETIAARGNEMIENTIRCIKDYFHKRGKVV